MMNNYKTVKILYTWIQRINVEYVENAMYMLNHNNPKYPLIVDVDKITEFLCEETKWSTSGTLEIDEIYNKFLIWLENKHNIKNFNKDIFTEKMSKKRNVINNCVQNIKFIEYDNSQQSSQIFRI